MGVTFDYATTTPVGDAAREAILAECELARQSHDWWCEAIWFSDSKRQGGRLVGWNKLLLGGYTAADGSYISIEEDDADDLMARRDVVFILNLLCSWSRRFGITWSLELAGVDFGTIVHGYISQETVEQFRQGAG